jgi:hypothetical protein
MNTKKTTPMHFTDRLIKKYEVLKKIEESDIQQNQNSMTT